jgi:D-hydroxyproline dehydrogenase subunit gamma
VFETVILTIDETSVSVLQGSSVVAAIASKEDSKLPLTRRSVRGDSRGPLCGMGICQECRVEIDGIAHRPACQVVCEPGMSVRTLGRK